MPFYEHQPRVQPLHQIVKEVMRGEIRVPRFHVSSTWRPEQRGDLLDSIYRGFPIGTILLWTSSRSVPTYDVVGGFLVPPHPGGGKKPHRILLDGFQRLSTLVQILGPAVLTELHDEGIVVTRVGAPNEIEAEERWVFELNVSGSRSESRERFRVLGPGQPPAPTQVPLDIVLRRSALNRWARSAMLSDDQESMLDGLQDRLREYSMPVANLVTNSLPDAVECYRRINSTSTPLGHFHAVAALAYTQEYDPQQKFDEARAEYLESIGWQGISDTDVLRIAAGLQENRNPLQLDVADLAKHIRNDRGLIGRAFQAVAAATHLLHGCGVHGPESLPYIWQLITLAVYLGRASAPGTPAPFDAASTPAAQRWFWITTYGEVFGGVNSAVVDRSLAALKDMLDGGDWSKMERDVTRQVRPVESFDFRTARSKACALAMARHQDGDRREGPAHQTLTKGVDAMALLFSRGRRSKWWHLAIVTPEYGVAELREVIKRCSTGSLSPADVEILPLLGVTEADTGSIEEILNARRTRLEAAERAFVRGHLKLTWD